MEGKICLKYCKINFIKSINVPTEPLLDQTDLDTLCKALYVKIHDQFNCRFVIHQGQSPTVETISSLSWTHSSVVQHWPNMGEHQGSTCNATNLYTFSQKKKSWNVSVQMPNMRSILRLLRAVSVHFMISLTQQEAFLGLVSLGSASPRPGATMQKGAPVAATTLPSTEPHLTMYANWAGPVAGSHCMGIRRAGVNPESSNRRIASPGLQTTPSKLWNSPASALPLTLWGKLKAGNTILLALVLRDSFEAIPLSPFYSSSWACHLEQSSPLTSGPTG